MGSILFLKSFPGLVPFPDSGLHEGRGFAHESYACGIIAVGLISRTYGDFKFFRGRQFSGAKKNDLRAATPRRG
jgi:hypothetical protein